MIRPYIINSFFVRRKIMKEKYYITTAIAYTSGKPHIGNVYDPLFADCIADIKD